MKQMIQRMLAAILIACGTLNIVAQEQVQPYFSMEELPDLLKFLPAPPDTLDEAFSHDIMRYFWGKQQRLDPERAAIAIRDADWTTDNICKEFSEPFGLAISPDGTPEIYTLISRSMVTADLIGVLPKAHYMRKRPFARFHEPSLYPQDDEELSHNGSYPSGHTLRGWSAALLLAEINPDRADTLLARGFMYSESRVIVGAHWQSDVDAGRLGACAVVMKLHTSADFADQLKRARQEFKQKTEPSARRRQAGKQKK